jgi:hypothetical protein
MYCIMCCRLMKRINDLIEISYRDLEDECLVHYAILNVHL